MKPFTHDALAQRTMERCAYGLLRPIFRGEYLLVTVCKQSRWAEIEFVTSTSARAVMATLDKPIQAGCPQAAKKDPRSTGRTSVT